MYANMNGDEDEDVDKEEKASIEGDESVGGGMKRRWTREGEMMIDELRATYANMNEDEDEEEDKEEKASSEGDESVGGNEEEMDKGGRDDDQRVEGNVPQYGRGRVGGR